MLSCLYYKKSSVAPVKGYVGDIVENGPTSCLMILDNGEYRRFLHEKVIVRVDRRPVYMVQLSHVGYTNVQVK